MFNLKQNLKAPAYTARMLLTNLISRRGIEAPKLKPFSHFTLACTLEDEAPKIAKSFDLLANFLKGPTSFKAEEVVNLGSGVSPLWAVKLSVEAGLSNKLSKLFDNMMCPERNGILYLWSPERPGQQLKCPHITIGPQKEDEETAHRLVAEEFEFIFDQMDYKKVGPHDPLLSQSLQLEVVEEKIALPIQF